MPISSHTYNRQTIPISGLQKLGDLLNFDGPILSLFKDDQGALYLFYWVDHLEQVNRWLIWKVNQETFYNYLSGEISLVDVLLCKEKDYVFSVDIDSDSNYVNATVYELRNIPTDFLPETRSYYKLTIPQFAKDIMESYENSENYYKILMKQKSLVFNISPTEANFARAVTTEDAGGFLSKLSRSMTGFIEESFWSKYKDIVTSISEFNRLLKEAKTILLPRLFGLNFGSFEIYVGIDTIKKISIDDFTSWQNNLLPEYERDVVNVDYNNESQLRQLSEKYSESAREKIYEPYIKIINSPHYKLIIKDKADKIVRTYQRVHKSNEKIVLPEKGDNSAELSTEKKFFNIVVELAAGQDVGAIDKRLLKSGLLFSQQLDELRLALPMVENDTIRLVFKSSIEYIFSLIHNGYQAFIPDLEIYLENSDKEILFKNLSSEIIRLYFLSQNSVDQSDFRKNYFSSIIDRIENLK